MPIKMKSYVHTLDSCKRSVMYNMTLPNDKPHTVGLVVSVSVSLVVGCRLEL